MSTKTENEVPQFPEAAGIFSTKTLPLVSVKDSAVVVLDTNALLVPYSIGKESLASIEQTYTKLIQERRFHIPSQVAREFASNRGTKIGELFQQISRRQNIAPFQKGKYPLLEGVPEYQKVVQLEARLDATVSEYKAALSGVLNQVRAWNWDDPVSAMYRTLFTPEVVLELATDRVFVQAERDRRYAQKIPPGYKDAGKDDGGAGDLIIWLTILQIASEAKRHVIFISGDEKTDWWHRSEGVALYPRFELIDEFRRASAGQSFHIVRFSAFLDLFDVSPSVVAEVQQNEAKDLEIVNRKIRGRAQQELSAEHAVESWFVNNDFDVARPPMWPFDFVARRDDQTFFVSVKYCRSAQLPLRAELADLATRMLTVPIGPSDVPILVVVPVDLELRELLADAVKRETGFERLQVRFGTIVDGAFAPADNFLA